MNTIDDLISESSKRILKEFRAIPKKFKTPQHIGEKKEQIVRNFLKEFFPSTYRFGKGEIIDTFGNRSPQIDIIICTPYHPFTFSESDSDSSLFFAEGVGCVIDVKSDLGDKRELERGIKQMQKVKNLRRKFENKAEFYGTVDEANRAERIASIIFGDKGPSDIAKLKNNINEINKKLKIPLEQQTDLFVVMDRGLIIYNINGPGYPRNWSLKNKKIEGLFGASWKEKTLFEFFFMISRLIPRETRRLPIITFYLENIRLDKPYAIF